MGMAGRKPKPDGQARNRAKPTHDYTEVVNEPFSNGKKLPKTQPDGEPWPKATREWWKAVSTMPHCALWSPTDWQFALDTAFVAARWHSGDLKAATELRNREKVLGTTYEYRRDLRIRYVEPEPDTSDAEVTKLDDFREL